MASAKVRTGMATMGEIIVIMQIHTGAAMVSLAILPLPPKIILTTEAMVPRWNMALVEVAIVDSKLPALFRYSQY